MEGRDERQAGFISVYEEAGAQGDRGPAKQTEADCPSLGTAQGSVHSLCKAFPEATTMVLSKYVLMTIVLKNKNKNTQNSQRRINPEFSGGQPQA